MEWHKIKESVEAELTSEERGLKQPERRLRELAKLEEKIFALQPNVVEDATILLAIGKEKLSSKLEENKSSQLNGAEKSLLNWIFERLQNSKLETEWRELLTRFSALESIESKRTFMQIAGYPHYENVCSNLLAFYLDPENEHGLDDLCFRSLIEAAGVEYDGSSSVNVERELNCQGKRLDLLVTSDQYVVGIENKIWHHLNNDLGIYQREIKKTARKNEVSDSISIVLGIRQEDLPLPWRSVTYSDFFAVLKSNLGNHSPYAQEKYVVYLHDFIRTIEELQVVNINQNQIAFFAENRHQIEEMISQFNLCRKQLASLIPKLSEMIGEYENVNKWIYVKRVLVFDFSLEHDRFAVDVAVDLNGWKMTLFTRGDYNADRYKLFLERLAEVKGEGFRLDNEGGRKLLYQSTHEEQLESIAEVVKGIVEAITESIKDVSANS